MMDTKKAYATLGLDENATDEEVEKRYTVLLLRSKKQTAGQDPGAPSMDEITKAYNFIKGIAIEEEIRKKEPKNKTFGKIEYVYEYYRWHIIGTIAAVLIVFFTASSIIQNRSEEKRIERADLKVTFFTDYQIQGELDSFEVKTLEQMTDWKDIHIVNQYSPTDPKDEYGMAMMQKAIISMAADKADIYIMDKTNYARFSKQGAFLRLDNIPSLASVPQEKRRTGESDTGETVWSGIDVSNHPAIKELKLPDVEKIALIRVNANKKDNAVKVLEWLSQ
ncbi:hypothetical protein [Paenibacillus mesotrionivorans]|uniref:Uncharacterized protein n=1 Tax=Paenibacillus mesotrionivorans TaxID=3160968 RepID=A0ACC7NT62_9BACL